MGTLAGEGNGKVWIYFEKCDNSDDINLGNAANKDRGDSHDDAAKGRDVRSQLSLACRLAWKHSLEVNLKPTSS